MTDFFSHVKWSFLWSSREFVTDQSGAHCFAQSFNHSLVSEYKKGIGTNLCKSADSNRRPVQEKDRSTQISFKQHRHSRIVQMAARKSLETMSGTIVNR